MNSFTFSPSFGKHSTALCKDTVFISYLHNSLIATNVRGFSLGWGREVTFIRDLTLSVIKGSDIVLSKIPIILTRSDRTNKNKLNKLEI